ncbi:MAG: flippase [Bacteroidota bacterium]|nr:flippase [Bacteroidota bacterium]
MTRVSKNIFSLAISEGGSRLIGFVTTVYLVRSLSMHDFGLISIAIAVFGYALLFAVHWFNTYGIRQVASGTNNDFIGNYISLRFILSVLIFIIVSILSVIIVTDYRLSTLIIYFTISIVPSALFLDWYFQGKEDLVPVSISKLIISAVYLLLLLLLLNHNSIMVVPLSFLFANVAGLILIFGWFISKYGYIKLSISISCWKEIIKESFAVSFASTLAQLNVNLPLLVVGVILTASDVAIFNVSSKLVFVLLIADRLLYSIYFPAITRIYSQNQNRISEILNFVLRWLILMILPLSLFCIVAAEPLINLVFGIQYTNSIIIFQVLIGYFLITMMNSVLGYTLVAIKQEKYFARTIYFGAVANIILVLLLTYYFGLLGTAIAIVAAELLILIAFKLYLKKFVEIDIIIYIFKEMPALAAMGLTIYYTITYNVALSFIAGLLIYSVLIYLFKCINKSDIGKIKELLLWK